MIPIIFIFNKFVILAVGYEKDLNFPNCLLLYQLAVPLIPLQSPSRLPPLQLKPVSRLDFFGTLDSLLSKVPRHFKKVRDSNLFAILKFIRSQ